MFTSGAAILIVGYGAYLLYKATETRTTGVEERYRSRERTRHDERDTNTARE